MERSFYESIQHISFHITATMEQLTLKPRQPVEDAIENWDDDDDLQGLDDLQFRNVSSTTVGSQPHHRDSISSRMSVRSDRESVGGGDEDWQVLLPTDDDKSTADAISSAKSAGIPIPQNVPTSALLGGTIKRLGGKRMKKVLGDDWGEDIEMPKVQDGGLKLRKNDGSGFHDSMRQFSAEFPSSPSPTKPHSNMKFTERLASATKSKALDKSRDRDDDFGDIPTIKLAKTRSPQKPINFIPPPAKVATAAPKEVDNFEDDFDFPDDGRPLRLSTQRETPKTPASQLDDTLYMEWAEGSLGTRFGGTRRDVRSNPSSSVSAFSPSASSRLTGGESEDEGLDDLILPAGPFRFEEALKKRLQENVSPEPAEQTAQKPAEKAHVTIEKAANDDFFAGIDIGDGEVFDSGKLTLNRNIKTKEARQKSPTRRTAMTLTFTNKIEPGVSKIPRPQSHDRPRSNLEPVSESGGPIPFYRRPGSRMMGHSAQSSLSSIPTPSTPSHTQTTTPSTPNRRGLNTSASRDTLKTQPPANTGFLKSKRSMPVMARSQPSPARAQPSYQRPPSRGGDHGSRTNLPSRPKTPVDRSGAESSLANARKPPVPFLPAGMSQAQSHHISTKSSRHFNNRPSSSDSKENMPVNRPLSRLSNMHRPMTPTTSNRPNHAPEALLREAASKRTLTKPTRRRAFGDGNELEIFDDLPTSASSESKFMKQPIARGAPKSVQMRSKLGMHHNNSNTSLDSHPPPPQTPSAPLSPMKHDPVPRFARDTNASRLAREHRMGSVSATLHGTPHLPTVREAGGPLSTLSTNFNKPGPPAANSKHLASPMAHRPRKINKVVPPQKPRLIKPMNEAAVNSAKTLKGMTWNPNLCRWEGNENAIAAFDAPPQLAPSLMSVASPKSPSAGKAPALITNVGASKGVQMSGGMVFDPARMCWLKMGPTGRGLRGGGSDGPMSPETGDEDEDPFAGLDDLEDRPVKPKGLEVLQDSFGASGSIGADGGRKKLLDEEEDLTVGEEFDVGPEFVRRQRVEEERWRLKVAGWVGEIVGRDEGSGCGGWKWDIREKAVELRGMI